MRTLSIPYIPRLDERPTWETVEPILDQYAAKAPVATVNWPEYPERPEVEALIARSSHSLFLKFDVTEQSVRGTYTDDGSPVYQDSCVEFFVRHPDDRRYLNFEFNCLGTCDAARRQSRELAAPLVPTEYQRIRRHASLGRTPVAIDDKATSWRLLIEIPFELMDLDPKALPSALRVNFYKCGDLTKRPHYLSWSPIGLPAPNFHCPEYFGEALL